MAKFKVSNDGEQLWKATVGGALTDAEKDATTTEVNHNIGMSDKGIYDYIQADNNLAATINNLMGASANENKRTCFGITMKPWVILKTNAQVSSVCTKQTSSMVLQLLKS